MNLQTKGKVAIVFGATGLVGSCLLELLRNDFHYTTIIAIGRKTTGWKHARFREMILDLGKLEELKLAEQPDDVFCALGTTIKAAGSKEQFRKVDHDFVLASAQFAARAGARQFLVISAMGADPSSRIFYNRIKGEMERDIAAVNIPCIQIFRPSLLLGKRREFRLGEKIIQFLSPMISMFFKGPFKKYKPVEAMKVAICMLACAEKNDSGVKVYENDFILSFENSAT